jgi:hypothetical protein
MAVENENTIMGVIESEIGGSPICEAVKQIAGTLFETSLNNGIAWSTDDIPVVQELNLEKNEGYFNTAIMKKEELAQLFVDNKDVFASGSEDCISAYIKLVEEINGIKD